MMTPVTNEDHILYRLDELKVGLTTVLSKQEEQGMQLTELRVDVAREIAGLKVRTSMRAALVGGLAGVLPAVGAVLLWLFK
jgi:hypothetical protein